jgi:hypothetical protein
VEGRALVALLGGLLAELSEVLGGLGNNVVVELEVNTAGGGWVEGKQRLAKWSHGILGWHYGWIEHQETLRKG